MICRTGDPDLRGAFLDFQFSPQILTERRRTRSGGVNVIKLCLRHWHRQNRYQRPMF